MSIKSLRAVIVGSLGMGLLVYGCAQNGDSDPPAADSDAGDDSGSFQTNDTGIDTGVKDTGADAKKDGGKIDTGIDAAKADSGSEGDPCNPVTTPSQDEACGKCGTRSRACLGGNADGGGATWAKWGACLGETSGPTSCDPAMVYPDADCGNCGKLQQICQNDCTFIQGLSCAEPANACHPGDVIFKLGLSCTGPNEGRTVTCMANCQLGAPSATCTTPPANPNFISISATTGAGGKQAKQFSFPAQPTIGRLGLGTCPEAPGSTLTVFTYIEVKNPTAQTAKVSVFTGPVSGGADIDTIMAAYPGTIIPPDNNAGNARNACVGSVKDTCSLADCKSQWAGLTGADGVSIPPNSSITIYHAAYPSSTGAANYMLYTITDSLN